MRTKKTHREPRVFRTQAICVAAARRTILKIVHWYSGFETRFGSSFKLDHPVYETESRSTYAANPFHAPCPCKARCIIAEKLNGPCGSCGCGCSRIAVSHSSRRY